MYNIKPYNILKKATRFLKTAIPLTIIAASPLAANDSTVKKEMQNTIQKVQQVNVKKVDKKEKPKKKDEKIEIEKIKKAIAEKEITLGTKINLLDGSNQFHESEVKLKGKKAEFKAKIGTALYNQTNKYEGIENVLTYSNEESTDLDGKNFELGAKFKIKEAKIGFELFTGNSDADQNSSHNEKTYVNQIINDITIEDSIRKNEQTNSSQEYKTNKFKTEVSRQILNGTLDMGSKFNIITNKSSNYETNRTIEQVIEKTWQDTISGIKDTTLLISTDTLTPETTSTIYNIENNEKIFIVSPGFLLQFGNGNMILGANYMLAVKEIKRNTNGQEEIPNNESYSLVSASFGVGGNKWYSHSLIGTSLSENGTSNFKNLKAVQTFSFARGQDLAQTTLEQAREKENPMLRDYENWNTAATGLNSMGMLDPTIHTIALTDMYKIFEADPEMHQAIIAYENINRMNKEGKLVQAGLNIVLAKLDKGTVNFTGEATYLEIGNQIYRKFTPGMIINYKALRVGAGAGISKSGKESATSIDANVQLIF